MVEVKNVLKENAARYCVEFIGDVSYFRIFVRVAWVEPDEKLMNLVLKVTERIQRMFKINDGKKMNDL